MKNKFNIRSLVNLGNILLLSAAAFAFSACGGGEDGDEPYIPPVVTQKKDTVNVKIESAEKLDYMLSTADSYMQDDTKFIKIETNDLGVTNSHFSSLKKLEKFDNQPKKASVSRKGLYPANEVVTLNTEECGIANKWQIKSNPTNGFKFGINSKDAGIMTSGNLTNVKYVDATKVQILDGLEFGAKIAAAAERAKTEPVEIEVGNITISAKQGEALRQLWGKKYTIVLQDGAKLTANGDTHPISTYTMNSFYEWPTDITPIDFVVFENANATAGKNATVCNDSTFRKIITEESKSKPDGTYNMRMVNKSGNLTNPIVFTYGHGNSTNATIDGAKATYSDFKVLDNGHGSYSWDIIRKSAEMVRGVYPSRVLYPFISTKEFELYYSNDAKYIYDREDYEVRGQKPVVKKFIFIDYSKTIKNNSMIPNALGLEKRTDAFAPEAEMEYKIRIMNDGMNICWVSDGLMGSSQVHEDAVKGITEMMGAFNFVLYNKRQPMNFAMYGVDAIGKNVQSLER